MKRFLAALAFAFLPALAGAQGSGTEGIVEFPLIIDYDADSATRTYCHSQATPLETAGATARAHGVDAFGIKVSIPLTAAASTTLAATTAGTNPFTGIQVGDLIYIQTTGNEVPDVVDALEGGQNVWLKVVTRASADSITVNQSLTTTAKSFYWRRSVCGTQAGYGWIPVRPYDRVKFMLNVSQLVVAATGITARVECRDDLKGLETNTFTIEAPAFQDVAGTATPASCGLGVGLALGSGEACLFGSVAVAHWAAVVDTRGFYECRMGVALDDDANDLTTNLEKVRIDFVGVRSK